MINLANQAQPFLKPICLALIKEHFELSTMVLQWFLISSINPTPFCSIPRTSLCCRHYTTVMLEGKFSVRPHPTLPPPSLHDASVCTFLLPTGWPSNLPARRRFGFRGIAGSCPRKSLRLPRMDRVSRAAAQRTGGSYRKSLLLMKPSNIVSGGLCFMLSSLSTKIKGILK